MGDSASMRAATLVNAEQAPKRVMRKSTAGKTGKAAIGWEASDERTGRFRRGIGGGTHTRGGWTQHGKPCRWCARYTVTSIDVLLRNVHSNTNFPTISINSGATLPGTIVATLQTPTSGASAGVNGGVKPHINGEQRVAEATTCRVERQRVESRQAAPRLLRCAPALRVTRRNGCAPETDHF